MAEKRKYDSTVARMAGNIAAGLVRDHALTTDEIIVGAVSMARAIIDEVMRTEPSTEIVFPTCPKCGVVQPCHAHSNVADSPLTSMR